MKNVKAPLSKKEKKVWEFLMSYFADYPYAPTRKEIKEGVGFLHIQQADRCIVNMVNKGWLKLKGRGWRNIIDPIDPIE